MGKNSQTNKKGGYRGGVVGDRTNPNTDKKAKDNKKSNTDKEQEVQTEQSGDTSSVDFDKSNDDFESPSEPEIERENSFLDFGGKGFVNWIKDNSLLASLDAKSVYDKDDDGKYKYSLKLRNAYGKFAKQQKVAQATGKAVSSLGRAISDGYSSGWGMR